MTKGEDPAQRHEPDSKVADSSRGVHARMRDRERERERERVCVCVCARVGVGVGVVACASASVYVTVSASCCLHDLIVAYAELVMLRLAFRVS